MAISGHKVNAGMKALVLVRGKTVGGPLLRAASLGDVHPRRGYWTFHIVTEGGAVTE